MSEPPGTHWDARRYASTARFVADLAAPVVDLLAPRRGERILDLGCGDGVLSARIAAAGCEVVAVDGSAEMVAAARARGVDARRVDGQALEFIGEFDAVFSNAALHWMPRGAAVIDGVARALRPRGRFVGEMGGHRNCARILAAIDAALACRGIDSAALNPWYFPGVDEYRELLEARGFAVQRIELLERPTPLAAGFESWMANFGQVFVAPLEAGARAALVAEIKQRLRPDLCGADGQWTADYVRLRFAARLDG